ncbi:unnamed protein product [Staurois parvus]|uniref:Ribosomal protein L39 n=1 Tax=Staurois parvus TaxID=386267 RepID=A0ABN9CVM2_9NEOB|nr:unnamed protein product [Staurois parvus]
MKTLWKRPSQNLRKKKPLWIKK